MESSDPAKQVIQTRTNENIPLNIEEYTENKISEPKKRGVKKLHISKFLLTVNSNIAAKNAEQANRIANCLKRGISMAIKTNLQEVFKIKPPAKDVLNKETIKSIDVQANGEIGPKYHRVHSHALVTVKHYTLLQMDSAVLRNYLLQYCVNEEIQNLFVSIKFIPVSDFAELYLNKGTPMPTSEKSNKTPTTRTTLPQSSAQELPSEPR